MVVLPRAFPSLFFPINILLNFYFSIYFVHLYLDCYGTLLSKKKIPTLIVKNKIHRLLASTCNRVKNGTEIR